MTRFQLYLLLLICGMCALLFETLLYSWPFALKYGTNESQNIFMKTSYEINQETSEAYATSHIKTNSNHLPTVLNKLTPKRKTKLSSSNNTGSNSSKHNENKASEKSKTLQFLADADNSPPWSYDRFIANMSQISKSKPNQQQFRTFLMSAFNPLNALPVIQQSKVKRVLLFAYFRSGSTFVGDLLQQNWKSFYSFEPLHYMSDGVRIDDQRADEAISLIDNIFRCNFNDIKFYSEWVKLLKNQFLFKWNKFLWGVCRFRFATCFEPNFLSQACQRAKVHVMKVVRLQMRHLKTLLPKVMDLDVHVVYLIRDPRGTLHSRQKLQWCTKQTNCSDIGSLCNEMTEDINDFNELQKLYPNKFTLIRYEDLSTNPRSEAKVLFDKLEVPFTASVRRYIKTHTNASISTNRNPYSTKRNSKSIAYEWRQMLNVSDILQVQHTCKHLLQQFNYQFLDESNSDLNITKTTVS